MGGKVAGMAKFVNIRTQVRGRAGVGTYAKRACTLTESYFLELFAKPVSRRYAQ